MVIAAAASIGLGTASASADTYQPISVNDVVANPTLLITHAETAVEYWASHPDERPCVVLYVTVGTEDGAFSLCSPI